MKHLIHPTHRRLSSPCDPEESRGGPADSACGYFDPIADELVYAATELHAARDACPACVRVDLGAKALIRDQARAIENRVRRRRWSKPFRGRR